MPAGRRLGLQVPLLVGREPADYNFELQRFLEALLDVDDEGIPAGDYGGDPEEIGPVADPGDEELGWTRGAHIHIARHENILDRDAPGSHPGSAIEYTVVTTTIALFVASDEDLILADASSNAITVRLPPAATVQGRRITVKKIDSTANVVKVDGDAAETIDGDADLDLLAEDEVVEVQSDGTEWWVV
jgi:hypothetical protein